MENSGICGAKAKTTGNPCQRPAGWGTSHVGQGRCRTHGGSTPTKHGLYSKYAKQRLSDKIEEALEDEKRLTDLRQQIALQIAMLENVLEKWDTGELTTSDGNEYSPVYLTETVSELTEGIGRNMERMHKIEHGEQLTIRIKDLDALLKQIVVIIGEEVEDVDTRDSIADRFERDLRLRNTR